ncbi:MAG: SoxR reducing system RseC family protein [Candidatus Cryptobacteroides sp.]
MASGKEISHKGKVLGVNGNVVSVEIVSQSACSACHAAGLCSMSEAVSKVVEVKVAEPSTFSPGETVDVLLAPSMGLRAVLAAYVVPLLILVALCIGLSYTGLGELYAGLSGLGGVALYYLILYFSRGRFAGEYAFTVRKENNY